MITRVGHPHGFSRITSNPSLSHWTFHLGTPALLSLAFWLPLVHTLGTTIVLEATQDKSHTLINGCQEWLAWVDGFQQWMSTLGWGHIEGAGATKGLPSTHPASLPKHPSMAGPVKIGHFIQEKTWWLTYYSTILKMLKWLWIRF